MPDNQAAAVPTLQSKPQPIVSTYVPFRLGIYGEGGVGKSQLALSFPDPIVVDTDGGLEGGAVADLPELAESWTPADWADLNGLSFWLKGQLVTKGYKTIIIDSVDTLARMLLREASREPNRSRIANAIDTQLITLEQQDYGKVALALDKFLQNLKTLSKAHGVHVVLISGVREPDVEKKRLKRTFNVQPAVEDVILYWANVYGELVVVNTGKGDTMEEHRVLWTRVGDPERKNKTRFAALRPGITDPTYAKMAKLVEEGKTAS